MTINTKRLIIRNIEPHDWLHIKYIWEDFNSSDYAKYDTPHSTNEDDVRSRIARWASFRNNREHMFFAVCFNSQVIGYIAFNVRENSYEIGYCFHSDFHGHGYAKESLKTLFSYMKTLGITRFSAGTALMNTPSVSLLKSLGFKLVNTEKVSFYKDSNGGDIFFDGGIFYLDLS